MIIALLTNETLVTGYSPAPVASIEPSFPQDVFIGDVQAGDIIEVGHTVYAVNFIAPDVPQRGGYALRITRLSDGFKARSHSLNIGKIVTLLAR